MKPAPFPAVSPLPSPAVPSWIAEIAPRGQVDENAQIRVRFAQDVTPLAALESTETQKILSDLDVVPAIPGHFILLTPRMIGFQSDGPLPLGTRYRVTLHKGLADLAGEKLASDLAWTFETTPITYDQLPGAQASAPPIVSLRPTLSVGSNVALDVNSLLAKAQLVPENGSQNPVALELAPAASPSPTASPQDESDASGERTPPAFSYQLAPAQPLAGSTTYRVAIGAGVEAVQGNLPADAAAGGRIRTYGPLTLSAVEATGRPADNGGSGRFVGGSPLLRFSNPVTLESARKAIAVSPAPLHGGDIVGYGDDPNSVVIDPTALAAGTRYTFHISDALTDAFGQHPARATDAPFTTTNLAADIWAPSGVHIFPAGRALALDVQTTNLPDPHFGASLRALKAEDLVYRDPDDIAGDPTHVLGAPDHWPAVPVHALLNAKATQSLPLRSALPQGTGLLAFGVSSLTNPSTASNGTLARVTYGGVVQVTNVGVFGQIFPHRALVRTNRLSDGSPIGGARVALYEARIGAKDQPVPAPCATGTTDATGALVLDGVQFARCAATSTSATEAPDLLAVARTADDWAFVRIASYDGGYADGLNGGWSAGDPEPRGAIVSDRALYAPGETAYFTAIAYFVENGVLGRGRASSYDVTIVAPSGTVRSLGKFAPDAFGAFATPVAFAKDQELGTYAIRARAANGEELDGDFRVAEFKPPNFVVALSLAHPSATMGTSLNATVKSDYLFGAPVAGATGHANVTRSRAYVSPTGFDAFSFGRSWLYPEEEPSVPSDVLDRDVAVTSEGTSAFDIPVASDLPFPMTYQADFQTTDVGGTAVSDTQTFLALPADALIGVSTPYVATAGKSLVARIAVVDPNGKPIAQRNVHVVLQKRTYATATQLVESAESPHESVEYATVAQADVESGTQPRDVSLAVASAGSYRIRANFAGATSDASATDADVWATGPGNADWGLGQSNQLTIKLNKTVYRPGETATALIASPYPDAELDFAVIRNGVLYASRTLVHGSAPQVNFRITPDMLPNAAVQAVLIRRGPSIAQNVPKGLDQLARIGFAAFNTALDDKYLQVVLAPGTPSLAPGGRQTVTVHLRDHANQPVAGEFALMVVNDAVLRLTGYRPPDLVKLVYADQFISTRWNDSRTNVDLSSPARSVEKGFGYGGGLMAGAGDTRLRTLFQAIAYDSGLVRTGADGTATQTFTLPDDLTTWRVLAVAFTRDARFGNGESTFVATKPLVTNPILPQFARPGDILDGGVSVTATHGTGNLSLDGTLGGGLVFVTKDGTTPKTAQQSSLTTPTQAFRFPMKVISTQDGRVQFTSTLGANHDGFEVPLLVRTNDVLETVFRGGVSDGTESFPVVVAPDTPTDAGGLELSLASTLAPDIAVPVQDALDSEDNLAMSVFSGISVLADDVLLRRLYRQPSDPRVVARLNAQVARFASFRAADGGLTYWSGASDSDAYLTAFAAGALARAREAGVAAAGADLAQITPYLRKALANPGIDPCCKAEPSRSSLRLAILAAFADMGTPRSDFLGDIVARESSLSGRERITLATVLSRAGGPWSAQAAKLRAAIGTTLFDMGRRVILNAYQGGSSSQAAIVRMLAEAHAPAVMLDGALSSLLAQRTNGSWRCPCEDAAAVDAILAYARTQGPPPNFTATVTVGGTHRSVAFAGYTRTTDTVSIPMSQLASGINTVGITKTGKGQLHYAVVYRYRPAQTQPGVYQGVRIDRIVEPAGSSTTLETFGLAAAQPLSVGPGNVFEIEDRIIVDHPVDQVAIVDPLPAGFEAIDQSFKTSTSRFVARADNWQIDGQTIYHDRVTAFARHLRAGVYAMHYLVRSTTPGTYSWPGASAALSFSPEEFGRTSAVTLTVQ